MDATVLRALIPNLSQHKSNTVRILNPSPSGARYTSRKNALRLVRRGIAVPSVDGASISYIASEWLAMLNARDAANRMDDRIVEERGGVVWWNGCDHRPNAMHLPGENVIFPKPDRAMPYFRALERS